MTKESPLINQAKQIKQAKILSIIRAVPKGSVASYGQIANIAGIIRGHRLVAKALRDSNIKDLPWYRIIRADGKCGMDEGSEGYIKQFSLLKSEGVIARNGQIDMKRYGWSPDLDFLLFRPTDL